LAQGLTYRKSEIMKSREQRAKSKAQRAKRREQRAESKEQRSLNQTRNIFCYNLMMLCQIVLILRNNRE